jgi:glycogen synthase
VAKLAFVAYESPFAPAGGIAAVIRQLPATAKEISAQHTVVITPWHEKCWRLKPNPTEFGSILVPFGTRDITVQVMHESSPFGTDYYFIKPETNTLADTHLEPGVVYGMGYEALQAELQEILRGWLRAPIFGGSPHPYRTGNHSILVRDSLLFGAAVIRALPVIAPGSWVLFLQDWETATAALAATAVPMVNRVRSVLTLHNSYDSEGIAAPLLRVFGIDPLLCPGDGNLEAASILERALPIVDRHIFTVSTQLPTTLLKISCKAR